MIMICPKYPQFRCFDKHCDNCDLTTVVDKQGQVKLLPAPKYAIMPRDEFRLCIQLWIRYFAPDVQSHEILFILQKRAPNLGYFPNLWAPVTGGVKYGETSPHAACREAYEELGLHVSNLRKIETLFHNAFAEDIYYADVHAPLLITLQKEEVSNFALVSKSGLRKLFNNSQLIPTSYCTTSFEKLFKC